MLKGIQVIGVIVGLYLIVQAYINYRKGINNIKRTAFWLILWSLMVVVFIDPSLSELALPVLSTQDAKISVMVLAILIQFILIVHMWQHINKMQQTLVELTQNLAITDYVTTLRTQMTDDLDE